MIPVILGCPGIGLSDNGTSHVACSNRSPAENIPGSRVGFSMRNGPRAGDGELPLSCFPIQPSSSSPLLTLSPDTRSCSVLVSQFLTALLLFSLREKYLVFQTLALRSGSMGESKIRCLISILTGAFLGSRTLEQREEAPPPPPPGEVFMLLNFSSQRDVHRVILFIYPSLIHFSNGDLFSP